ncbi:MAG: thioredoxin domain-containing protein [Blastocatellia bacterium]|nr:thioredoxin domain-containing protein [Blastocatellia bacterium]MCS7156540.1 thioredoxin domain-containing protein [Blastocatellia bacterium]MCX7751719.1 thioredoxin domain-containing protein [Blastocatellia bacterium]MDW8168820.1 vitamin K epoxide reductase family protein [Acidobacteriota bacterium]MDW8257466.1 vitamin K epoxide reductase family protein [Acidobacteriota bacterium]
MKREKHQSAHSGKAVARSEKSRDANPEVEALLRSYRWIRRAAALGLLSALYLTWHYKLFLSGAGDQALCNVSELINCDRVAASSWSRLFGLPLAVWGAGGYLALIVHTTRVLRRTIRERRERWPTAPSDYAVSTLLLIVPFVIGLAILPFVSLVHLRALCLGCAVSWIADLGLLIFGIHLLRRARVAKERAVILRPLWPSVALGALLIVPLNWYARPSPPPTPVESKRMLEEKARPVAEATDVTAPSPLSPTFGSPGAPITIVYFTDFQCPYCKLQTEALRQLLARRPRQVRVIYRHYPLDQACNLRLTRTAHSFACLLAQLAIEAQRRGAFEAWSTEIWRAQESLTLERIHEIARRYGLDPTRVAQDPEIQRQLARDISLAERSGVDSTPTLIINGRLIRGYQPVERLESFVAALLQSPSGPMSPGR